MNIPTYVPSFVLENDDYILAQGFSGHTIHTIGMLASYELNFDVADLLIATVIVFIVVGVNAWYSYSMTNQIRVAEG
jgi:hypothetical protein